VAEHRPSVSFVAAALAGLVASCDLTPPPRAMREPDSTDEDDPMALMAEPHSAEGPLRDVAVVVRGKAPERYRQALERALMRAGLKVVEVGQPADFDLDLAIDADAEDIPIETEDSSEEEVDKEFERFRAKLVITRGDQPVATLESTPRFELRTVTASGKTLSTKRSLDQADIEFCGAGMNGLVTKLVHSAAVNEEATRIMATKPANPSDAAVDGTIDATSDAAQGG
jgi:hypothetical protein